MAFTCRQISGEMTTCQSFNSGFCAPSLSLPAVLEILFLVRQYYSAVLHYALCIMPYLLQPSGIRSSEPQLDSYYTDIILGQFI
jgi:hypothetical protein